MMHATCTTSKLSFSNHPYFQSKLKTLQLPIQMPPRRRRRPTQTTPIPTPYTVDFRAPDDDAWYGVSLRLEDGGTGDVHLRVMFSGFPEFLDERVAVSALRSTAEVEGLGGRFRRSAKQLQDSECGMVRVGMRVCGALEIGGGNGMEVKFYDAVVQSICNSEHKFVDGIESCSCRFVLSWEHGPNSKQTTSCGIEGICNLQDSSKSVDPALDHFLELARKRLAFSQRTHSPCHPSVREEQHSSFGQISVGSPLFGENKRQTQEGANNAGDINSEDDIDLGGGFLPLSSMDSKGSFYFIWVENVDKDISPENIVDFLFQQTSISSEALLFPSLYSKSYKKGLIYLDSKAKVAKLLNFLNDPLLLVVSFRGRPWVIPQKRWYYGSAGDFFSTFPQTSLIKTHIDYGNKIKMVREGTVEFDSAKRLHDLFLEFHDHLQELHKSLAIEEKKIMMLQTK